MRKKVAGGLEDARSLTILIKGPERWANFHVNEVEITIPFWSGEGLTPKLWSQLSNLCHIRPENFSNFQY